MKNIALTSMYFTLFVYFLIFKKEKLIVLESIYILYVPKTDAIKIQLCHNWFMSFFQFAKNHYTRISFM